MSELAYELQKISCKLGDAQILDSIDLRVSYGKVLVLAGPNGAGKSTLLGVLAGDLPPSAGQLQMGGAPIKDYDQLSRARTRAMLLQSNQVAFSFSAAAIIEMGRAPWIGTPAAAADDAAISQAVASTDTAKLLPRSFQTLSGGEKSRVSFARVLAQRTRIVLLDEPTAALDLSHQEAVLTHARALAAAGSAIVVVLHDLSLAAAYADEIAILKNGRLLLHGSPAEVVTAAQISEVYGTPVQILPDPLTGRPVVIPRRTL